MSDAIHSTNDTPLTPILKPCAPPTKPKIEQLDPITRRHGSLTGPQLLTAFYTGIGQATSNSYPESVRTFRRAYLKMVHPESPDQTHGSVFVDTESSRSLATPLKQVHFSPDTKQDVFPSSSEQHDLTSGEACSGEPTEHPYFSLAAIDKPLKQTKVKGEAVAVESKKHFFSKRRDSLKKTKVAEIFRGVKRRVSPKPKAADKEQEDYTLHNVSNEIPLLNITSPDSACQASRSIDEERPAQISRFAVEPTPKNESAVSLVNRLTKARLAFNVGILKAQQGSYHEATLWLHKATKADPRLAVAWYALGNAYSAQCKWGQAIQALRVPQSLADWEPWTVESAPSSNPYVRHKSVLPRNNVLHNAHLARQNHWWTEMVATYKRAIPILEDVVKQARLSPDHRRAIQARLDEYLSFHRRYLAAEPSSRDKFYPTRERSFMVPPGTFLAPPKELEEMYPDHVPGRQLCVADVVAEEWRMVEERRSRAKKRAEEWLAGLPEEEEGEEVGPGKRDSLVPAPLFASPFAERGVEEGREMFPHAREGEWRSRTGEEEGDRCFVVEDVFMEEARQSLLLETALSEADEE